ncbi:hypothetical protein [Neolewinella litorea]|uniref:Uncharacterized protein n=1 Tax=Neolewinella litorea TaxID=2562452 RepID=A0A4S4NMQ1_9BACT|nr:hypothetical protein [Neolewinella litorea]THH39661.1 hypothetical protein E4021_08570 [Neolewinella litorea]
MPDTPHTRPITEDDFGPSFYDYESELREMAVEIGNELQRNEPEKPRSEIVRTALQRARRWWLDRAG